MPRTNHDPITVSPPVRKMVVVSIPAPFPDDPYVDLFYRSLFPHGIELGPAGPYTLGWLVSNRGTVDAFHFHWLHLFYNAPSRARALVRLVLFVLRVVTLKASGFRLFWTAHNIGSHEQKHPLLDVLAARLMTRFADRIFAHGPVGKAAVASWLGRADIVELPLFAYVGYYPDTIDRGEARRILGLREDDFVLLAFGKLRLYKGIDQLIEAFRKNASAKDRLVIAGRPESRAIERELRGRGGDDDRIRFETSFVSNSDVQTLYRAADVAVYPYRDILTSGGVATALAFGTPVVAPRLGSIPDQVGARAGVLYEGGRLWDAIEQTRRSDRVALMDASRERGRELSWDKIGQLAARAFREAVE